MGISTDQLEVDAGTVFGSAVLPAAGTLPSGTLLPSTAAGPLGPAPVSVERELMVGAIERLETRAGSSE